jgi:hypothetical protein
MLAHIEWSFAFFFIFVSKNVARDSFLELQKKEERTGEA